MSLLNDSQKAAILSIQSQLHNEVAQTLVYFKDSEEVVVSTNPNHSFLFNSPANTTTTKVAVTGEFLARVYYGKDEPEVLRSKGFDNSVILPHGWVKIIVDESGNSVIKDAKTITFDEDIFTLLPYPRRHGLIEKNMFSYHLKPNA